MPSGEVYSFIEGKLYLFPSASGTVSGSALAFVEDATLRLSYGHLELAHADHSYSRPETGRRADLTINQMLAFRTVQALADASAAVNAKFEGSVGGLSQSAQIVLYSGSIDSIQWTQRQGDVFHGGLTFHCTEWSGFGQA